MGQLFKRTMSASHLCTPMKVLNYTAHASLFPDGLRSAPFQTFITYCSSFPSLSCAKHVCQRFIITPALFFNETVSSEKNTSCDVEGIVHLKTTVLSSFAHPGDLVSVENSRRC